MGIEVMTATSMTPVAPMRAGDAGIGTGEAA
jgi:hypothetical protein